MTTSTRVGALAPRRPLDDLVAEESLPADLTVQVGVAGAPIANPVPLQEFVASAGNLSHAQRMTIVGDGESEAELIAWTPGRRRSASASGRGPRSSTPDLGPWTVGRRDVDGGGEPVADRVHR